MNLIGKPKSFEYGSFFAGYVDKVESEDIIEFLTKQIEELQLLLRDLSDEQAWIFQQPFTWTIKQLLGHLIDGEKVFGYRLHRMACGDTTPLPGFEHEPYVANLDYLNVALESLVRELVCLRESNVCFLRRLPAEAASRTGIASDAEFTVRGQAFVIGGHVQHHLEILKERVKDLS